MMRAIKFISSFFLPILVFGIGISLTFVSCETGVTDADFSISTTAKMVESNAIESDTAGNPLKVQFIWDGTGTSDLLGEVSMTVAGTGDLVAGTSSVKITLVDSRGDTIFLDGSSADKPDGSFTATETITGGTGRYANVSGTTNTTGQADQEAGTGEWETKGKISY